MPKINFTFVRLNLLFIILIFGVGFCFSFQLVNPKKKFDKLSSRRSVLDSLSSAQLRELFDQIRKEEAVSERQCSSQFTPLESQIIRTKDSIKNGATFLTAVPNIFTAVDCRDKCCRYVNNLTKYGCNLAVFQLHKIDEKPRCFLFDCFNSSKNFSCLFSSNSGFTSYKNPLSKVNAAKVVDELQNVVKTQTHLTTALTRPTTVLKSTSIVTTTTTRSTLKSTSSIISTTTQSTAKSLQPISKEICAISKCKRLEWRCDNNCCISYWKLCDGVSQCSDGSDEVMCPTTSLLNSTSHTKKKVTTSSHTTLPLSQQQTTLKEDKVTHILPLKPLADVKDKEIHEATASKTDLGESDTFKEKDTVEKATAVDPEAGAILPLAIGLAITGCVLIMVACRVRTMKKKLRRRGKALAMDESDYLINGMYL